MDYLLTSESVTEGHPDKICDQISDAILDALLEQDKNSKVAVETLATTGFIHVAGEIRTEGYVEIPEIVRGVIRDIGYTSSEMGFDANSCGVTVSVGSQSLEIAQGVDNSLEAREGSDDPLDQLGAGDQGLMFGYATDETPELMPMPIILAHRMAEKLTEVRKANIVDFLRPDGKTQVTLRYVDDRPVAVETIVVSTQHRPNISQKQIRDAVLETVVFPILEKYELASNNIDFYINPSGSFILGGPAGDAGLTGRKIIVDTYGGAARHGGGAFSGKDPSKVDRSAAYAMRWVAKNIVAAKLAKRVELQVAYAIGKSAPVSLKIDAFGTELVPIDEIRTFVKSNFDLRPAAIIEHLSLLDTKYQPLASYGHFGRDPELASWESTRPVLHAPSNTGSSNSPFAS
jgi:S-adenosylmethionine synthetase